LRQCRAGSERNQQQKRRGSAGTSHGG
jgi:hypothetical protein